MKEYQSVIDGLTSLIADLESARTECENELMQYGLSDKEINTQVKDVDAFIKKMKKDKRDAAGAPKNGYQFTPHCIEDEYKPQYSKLIGKMEEIKQNAVNNLPQR